MNFEDKILNWDRLIRQGQGREVAGAIAHMKMVEVPQRLRPDFAALARRLGLYRLGLDILRQDYYEIRDLFFHTEPREQHENLTSEYAAILTEIGASRIAEKILRRYPKPQLAKTFFYRGLLAIKKWDHENAVVDLRAFRALCQESYWQNVADLNLAGSLIFLHRFAEARQILDGLENLRSGLNVMSVGILDELQGQILFLEDRRDEARRHFEKSWTALSGTHHPSLFFAEKWLLLGELLDQPWNNVQAKFVAFRERARCLGYWEVLRELDRFRALKLKDETLLRRLYFGTPALGYRQMICRDFQWQPPKRFQSFYERPPSGDPTPVFDVQTLQLSLGPTLTKSLSTTDQHLLKALTADLYRPLAVGSLFEQIYPGQHYDPVFAAQRVHQAIRRFRRSMKDAHLLIQIDATELGFQIAPESCFSVLYQNQTGLVFESSDSGVTVNTLTDAHRERLWQVFSAHAFTAREAAQALGVSQRSIQRILLIQVEHGHIEKRGSGSRIHYLFKEGALAAQQTLRKSG